MTPLELFDLLELEVNGEFERVEDELERMIDFYVPLDRQEIMTYAQLCEVVYGIEPGFARRCHDIYSDLFTLLDFRLFFVERYVAHH